MSDTDSSLLSLIARSTPVSKAVLLTLAFTLLMLTGTKSVARFMRVMVIVVWAGMALWYLDLLVTSSDQFQANFQAVTGSSAQQVIDAALAERVGPHFPFVDPSVPAVAQGASPART